MKILYISMDSLNHSIRICNILSEKGHAVTLIALEQDYYDNANVPGILKNIKLIRLPIETLENPDIFPFNKIPKKKYDLVFGSTVRCVPVCNEIKKRLKIPWYNMLLDVPIHLMEQQLFRRKAWEQMFLPLLENTEKVLVNTNIAKEEYLRISHKYVKPCEVITYPTHLPEKFYGSGAKVRGDYIISVGRLTGVKNFGIIPIAMSMLKTINKYVAIGPDKGQLSNIKQVCKEHNIEFEHYSDIPGKQKMELIKNSAMMVYPQHTEFIGGLPPYEGMFCGKPVICSDFRVLKDLYKKNVIYFKSGGVADLAKNISFIENMRDELYHGLGMMAAEFARVEASYEKFAEELIEFLRNNKKVNKK